MYHQPGGLNTSEHFNFVMLVIRLAMLIGTMAFSVWVGQLLNGVLH